MIRKIKEDYRPDEPYFKMIRGERSVFRNRTLSMKARGLFCTIWSLPEAWDFSVSGLAVLGKDSAAGIKTGLRELENAGYIRIEQDRKNGRFSGNCCVVSESPMSARP